MEKEKNMNELMDMGLDYIKNYDFAIEIIRINLKNKKYKGKKEQLANELLDVNTPIIGKYILYKNYFEEADPDICSRLLKEIIRNIWEEKYLNNCISQDNKGMKTIHTDTMTSVQTLINQFYLCVCNENNSQEWESYKRENNAKYFSKKAMEIMYRANLDAKDDELPYPIFHYYFHSDNKDSKIILDFISHYHTLGNYIPVPDGFNTLRSGNYGSHDMWDITLMKIKEYYDYALFNPIKDNNHSILELLHIDKGYDNTYKWLATYGSQENFMKKNYLGMYIENDDILSAFKEKHRFNHPELKTKDDYLAYFETITNLIKKRTETIYDEMK